MNDVVESTGKSPVKLGQYLQPSRSHLPVQHFVHPDVFAWFAEEGTRMGFKNVASGPLVRSSYHADQHVQGATNAVNSLLTAGFDPR